MALRDFQKEVYRLVVKERKNVILQAPTGAGKTLAAIYPFIRNLEQEGDALPYKCLYATPLRTLTNQFYEEYKDWIERIDKKRGTNFVQRYQLMKRPTVSIQTGEQPSDPQFESPLTFCTIDQLLASAIGTPYSIGTRMANINAAAVFGSYLVLDEFHLYPLAEDDTCFGARTTVLELLMLLKGVTRFVLMTATLSQEMIDELSKLLDAVVVKVEGEELAEIMQERQRTIRTSDQPMTAKAILAQHDQCSLVVCNTVARAQMIYWQLKDEASRRGIELVLLHSRLTDEDRRKRTENVTEQLGKFTAKNPAGWKGGQYFGKNMIVVATQVIEVGLDISVQVLHTESAPANSVIQRAGRCARFEKQQGRVIVYPLAEVQGKSASTKPYDKALCDATFEALKQRDPQQPFDFLQEQALINMVHSKSDLDLLKRFKNREEAIQKLIFEGLRDHSRSIISTLIRDVAQVRILIHNKPEEAITEAPWQWQSFALHPASLASHMEFFEAQRDALKIDWVCKEARAEIDQNKNSTEEEVDSRQKTTYTWDLMASSSNKQSLIRKFYASLMLALQNALATYHPELGFILRSDSVPFDWPAYESPKLGKKGGGNNSAFGPIKVQSYIQHIGGLVDAYNTGIVPGLKYVMERLETTQGLPTGSIEHAIRLAIACHDLGKLSEQWQAWADEWQKLLYAQKGWLFDANNMPRFYAKTDYDSSDSVQKDLQKKTKNKRPNHACESVVLGMDIIADSLGMLVEDPLPLAIYAAIAHHHSANASTYKATRLQSGAEEAVEQALQRARQTFTWSFNHALLQNPIKRDSDLKPANGDPEIAVPNLGMEQETWLYYVIVRALRLADQHADDFSANNK